ncbi:MAG TPA: HlyC/CorC family transporter, partial [Acholeplasmataceae bacterium]|nr:HlyC/CorC family transporter [Acholeplasmataceae bacterium]
YILIPFTYIYTLVVDKIYKPKKKTMTEDALLVMVDRAEQEFGINENESKLIKSVLDFDELKVLDIYTPRVDLVAISKNATNDEIVKVFRRSGFSRLPVYDENVDDIIGIINHKDFYNKVLLEKKTLNDILSKPLEVTEYMDVSNLLALLKSNQEHLAVVKDEYGGTLGIVTMEDILEELVGDIWDEHDNVVEAIQLVEENKYLVHGSTYLSDLIDKLELDNLEDDDNVTVNGWITSNLGKIGSAGDSFVYDNLDVKVVTASQKKVFEVIINVLDIKENNEE